MATRLSAMLRSARYPDAHALGKWSVAELAAHVSHAADGVPAMAKGGGGLIADIWGLADLTGALVRGEAERDLSRIADRIDTSVATFVDFLGTVDPNQLQTWFLPQMKMPLTSFICHVLNELTVHGWDIAAVEKVPWPIDRTTANLVVNGFLFPVIAGTEDSLVNPETARGVKATFAVHVKGGGDAVFRFDDGHLQVHIGPPLGKVDCHLLVEPAAFLLVAWGRISQWNAIPKAQLLAYGRKPWLGLKFRSLLRNP